MQTLLIVLTVIVSILLIGVVLIQKSKGGGLASNFAGSNQIMGVRRTNNFIEKATWSLAIVILFLSILSSIITPDLPGAKYDVAKQKQQTTQTDFNTNADADATAADATSAE
ncbi:MAG: preprotein translocase subunit SecG [Muribaculaceae bacterium]|nr:preprotein translocase subunit SecG [Muribaculaceae bacterium]